MPGMGINRRQLEREEAREEKRRRQEEARQVEIAEAREVIETWNTKVAAGRRILSAPTFGAARLAGYRWLTVYCPGCGTVKEIDLAKIDRHPDASITSLIPDLSCRMCRPHAPFAQLRRLTRDRMLEHFHIQRNRGGDSHAG